LLATLDHQKAGSPFFFFYSPLSKEQKLNAENCRTNYESTGIHGCRTFDFCLKPGSLTLITLRETTTHPGEHVAPCALEEIT
jgi:hypothetical protein